MIRGEIRIRKIKKNQVYRHFKGKFYFVEDIAYDSETMKQVVVYRQLYDDKQLFVRSLEMFLSPVDHDKYPHAQQKYRFEEYDFDNKKQA